MQFAPPTSEAADATVAPLQHAPTPPDETPFEDAARLTADVFAARSALLVLRRSDGTVTLTTHGLDTLDAATRDALVAAVPLAGRPQLLPNARHPQSASAPALTVGGLDLGFWMSAPLVTTRGEELGWVGVLDAAPRPDASSEMLGRFQRFAALLAGHLRAGLAEPVTRQVEQEWRLLEAVVENASDELVILRAVMPGELVIHYVNRTFTDARGCAASEFVGKSPDVLYGAGVSEQSRSVLRRAVREGTAARAEFHATRRNGAERWVEVMLSPLPSAGGRAEYWVATLRDVTERKLQEQRLHDARVELERHVGERTRALQELNQQLEHDALHDALTGLPNRTLFNARLQQAIDGAQGKGEASFAVLFLDCDRFKVINDTLGHSVGDGLLVAFSRRLQSLIRPSDTVARLGGDEFTVLLEDLDALETALRIAERLQRAFSTPFYVGPHVLHIGASIGVVSGAAGYTSADDVMRDADIAMYKAKSAGRGRFVQFDVDMREKTVNQMRLESELRSALLNDQLDVYFQPIMNVERDSLHGFEALARWPHPERGMISPAEFIPLAEETGLIIELDRWVLFEACRRMMELKQRYPRAQDLSLSVNLSTQQFTRTDFLETLELVLHASDFPSGSLMVELTEGLVMQRSEQVMANIKGLRERGVQLHIDDFGTGYSSLSYLQQFAPNSLKIDQAFVAQMLERPASAELVRTIIAMAHNLGMTVVAEGVETPEQLAPLKAHGCEYAQGYYFSRPLDLQGVEALLASGKLG